MPVHAHINVLDWVSLSLFGVFYKLWPEATEGSLAGLQFGLFNAGTVVQAIGVTLILPGDKSFAPVAAGGSALLILGMLCLRFWSIATPGREGTTQRTLRKPTVS